MLPGIDGLNGPDPLGADDGVHLLHSMGDTFALMRTLEQRSPTSALIVGAGYIGLEMAEALTARGLSVTQMEQLPEVLPTVDPELGALVHAELEAHGVEVLTNTTVKQIRRAEPGDDRRLRVDAVAATGRPWRDRSTWCSSSSVSDRTANSPRRRRRARREGSDCG